MKNNNIYLAKLVSFERSSLLFQRNNLDNNINSEEFRLVELRGVWAYDLITYKRYYLITNADGTIDDRCIDKLQPNILYAYELYDFIDIYDDIKKVYGIDKTLDQFLEEALNVIEKLDDILNPDSNNKIIDFQKIKALMLERK